jgi:hypothetical protein
MDSGDWLMTTAELQYHHLGIPTEEPRENEVFLPEFGMYVTSHTDSPFRIEWIRFEEDSPLPELVRRVPHIAFQVDDLQLALEDREVLIEPNSPSPGVRVAFIVWDGAPVEFLEFHGDHPDRLPGGGNTDWPGDD